MGFSLSSLPTAGNEPGMTPQSNHPAPSIWQPDPRQKSPDFSTDHNTYIHSSRRAAKHLPPERPTEHSCGLWYTPNGDARNLTSNLMLLMLLGRIPMPRLPRPVLLPIPHLAFYNPAIEVVCPRMVDPHPGVNFRRLRSLH